MRIRRLVRDVDKAFAQPSLLGVAGATQGQSALVGAASDPALAVVLQDRVMFLGVEEWMAKAWIATNKVMLLATWKGIEP